MKLSCAIITSFLVILVHGSGVLQVNDQKFKDVVITSGKYTLVKFYADWCRHCKNMLPAYEEVSRLFENEPNVQIVKINGDKDGRKMSKKYNIEGFPTVMLFHENDEPIEFNGARDADAMSNFVQHIANIRLDKSKDLGKSDDEKSQVLELNDLNFQEKVLDNDKATTIVAFTALWCGHCKTLLPIWEKLANDVYVNDDKIVIGKVVTDDSPADKLMSQFGVTSFPTILYFDSSKVDEDGLRRPVLFYGDRSLEQLVSFINEKAGLHRDTNGELLETAGKISKLDELIRDKLPKLDGSGVGMELLRELNKIIALSTSLVVNKQEAVSIGDDLSMAKYYKKLINNVINGETEFFDREINRLTRMIQNNKQSLQKQTIDSIQKRLNVLSIFTNHL